MRTLLISRSGVFRDGALSVPPSLLRRHKYMIFKINPSFVLPHCLPARSPGCLSVCLFIVPIWSRINFTPLFVPFAVGVGGKRRRVKRDRQKEGREGVSRRDGGLKEGRVV